MAHRLLVQVPVRLSGADRPEDGVPADPETLRAIALLAASFLRAASDTESAKTVGMDDHRHSGKAPTLAPVGTHGSPCADRRISFGNGRGFSRKAGRSRRDGAPIRQILRSAHTLWCIRTGARVRLPEQKTSGAHAERSSRRRRRTAPSHTPEAACRRRDPLPACRWPAARPALALSGRVAPAGPVRRPHLPSRNPGVDFRAPQPLVRHQATARPGLEMTVLFSCQGVRAAPNDPGRPRPPDRAGALFRIRPGQHPLLPPDHFAPLTMHEGASVQKAASRAVHPGAMPAIRP